MYRILTIDGGGIKGLYSAVLLQRLLARFPTLIENVDLIAGTSTGGVLALGLAAGKTPEELANLYRLEGRRIFDDSIWDDLRDLGNAVGADYGNAGLKAALRKHLKAHRLRLRDLKKRVLIPAFDLDAAAADERPRMWKPKFFHNYPGKDSDGAKSVLDVALATSSAPTFFPSHKGYVDGGVVANNPSMSALAQALSSSGAGQELDSIVLLSIGSGMEPKYLKGSPNWGWGQWARPLVSLMISGVMGVADYQSEQVLGRRYRRLESYLDHPVNLDDARPETLEFLTESAEQVPIRSTVNWLKRMDW